MGKKFTIDSSSLFQTPNTSHLAPQKQFNYILEAKRKIKNRKGDMEWQKYELLCEEGEHPVEIRLETNLT